MTSSPVSSSPTGERLIPGSSRRQALSTAGIALLGALGPRDVSAKQGPATAEQHRNGDGHRRGKTGKRGESGPGGPAGSPGSQGSPGEKGERGGQGEKGDAGNPGDKGDKGDKGDAGNPGDKGDKGDNGDTGPQGAQGPGRTMLTGSTTWGPQPQDILNGLSATTTVSVGGAAKGDPVMVGYTSISGAGLNLYGQVTSAGTVTVTLTNHTGGTQTVLSGTVNVVVVKP